MDTLPQLDNNFSKSIKYINNNLDENLIEVSTTESGRQVMKI